MGVSSTHPDYDKYFPKWKRARDVIAGQDAIHAARTDYLPKLKDESDGTGGPYGSDDDYSARLRRSDFFNGTWRTIAGFGGMAFRKSPTVEVPAGVDEYLKDITLSGTSMESLAVDVLDDVLSVGRIGVLVDHPAQPENVVPLTVAAAQQRGLRPMMQLYPAESIINWKCGRINNAWQLTMVVLKELITVPKDEFADDYVAQYRVLDLIPNEKGVLSYRQRLFMVQDEKDVQIGGDIYPLMNGKTLDYIPFAVIGPDGRDDDIDDPPLIDLVDANIALYQLNSDYRHGLHFTGLPTPYVCGYTSPKPGEKFCIGSLTAWVFPDPNAKVGFLEFQGQGLDALKDAIADKKQEMAMLGARMIADDSKQAQTYGEAQIKRQGENGYLARIVQGVSEALEWALGIFAEWSGHPGEVTYELNRDFLPTMIDALSLTAWVGALQASAVSQEEFFDWLQRGDAVEAEKTFEEHQEQIASQSPPKPVAPVVAANDQTGGEAA